MLEMVHLPAVTGGFAALMEQVCVAVCCTGLCAGLLGVRPPWPVLYPLTGFFSVLLLGFCRFSQ